MIGRTVTHYRILERLGGGGMGVVYKAEDTKLGRVVALKFLPPELTRDDEARQRFLIEARAAAKLEQPNVCPVYEIAETDEGRTFIVMSYYEGEPLSTRIARGPIPVAEAAGIVIEVSRGLAVAHQAGIIHRDIKPSNIMLTAKGGVKIVDFGVAKLAGVTMTHGGGSPGTLAYMAPEQIRGEAITPAADLWALGAVLYEMVSGSRPFRGEYEHAIAYTILNEPPAKLDELLAERPPALDSVLERALAKDPRNRFQTADELIAELEPIAGARASVVSFPARAVPPRALVAALVTILLLAAGGWFVKARRAEVGARVPIAANADAVPVSGLEPKRVVVAVFENRTGDPSLDPVGRLASDWISDLLTRIEIDVMPSRYAKEAASEKTSVPRTAVDPAIELAESTKSGLLVTGEYYLNGSILSVHARIVETASRKVLEVLDAAEGPRSNPNEAIQIAGETVRDAIGARLLGSGVMKTADAYGGKPMRYESYVELNLGHEARLKGDLEASFRHRKRAVELDPQSPVALLFLADEHSLRGESREALEILARVRPLRGQMSELGRLDFDAYSAYLEHRSEDAVAAQRDLVRRSSDPLARRLLPQYLLAANRPRETVEFLARLGLEGWNSDATPSAARDYCMMLTGALAVLDEHERELTEARRCASQFPDVAAILALEARALAALGRFDELDALLQRSLSRQLRLGTPAGIMYGAAAVLHTHGQEQKSREMARRAVEWQRTWHREVPENEKMRAESDLAHYMISAGELDEAEPLVARLYRESAGRSAERAWVSTLGCIAAANGNRKRALQYEARLQSLREPYLFGQDLYARARIVAQLGDRDDAVSLLRRAISEGLRFNLSTYPRVFSEEPALDALRGYPPYEELIKPRG